MSENINEKIEKLQAQFIDNLNFDKKKYDKLKDEITTMKKDYKELEQNIQNKIEGLENHYNIKTLTNTINMLIDNNIKVKELEQKLSNFGETLGSQMGINLKALSKYKELEQRLQDVENNLEKLPYIDNLEEFTRKLKAFNQVEKIEAVLRDIIYKHINKNGDEYGKDIEKLLKQLDGEQDLEALNRIIYKNMGKSDGEQDEPPDPIEIIIEHTHAIIKFENEIRKYTYLEGRFTEPNQLLLILERDLETISETKKPKTISNVELAERLRAMVWNDGNEKKVNMNQFYTLIEKLEEDLETTASRTNKDNRIEIELIEHDGDLWSLRTNPESYLNRGNYQRQSTHYTGINLDEFLADQTHGLYNGSIKQLEIIIKHKEEE